MKTSKPRPVLSRDSHVFSLHDLRLLSRSMETPINYRANSGNMLLPIILELPLNSDDTLHVAPSKKCGGFFVFLFSHMSICHYYLYTHTVGQDYNAANFTFC